MNILSYHEIISSCILIRCQILFSMHLVSSIRPEIAVNGNVKCQISRIKVNRSYKFILGFAENYQIRWIISYADVLIHLIRVELIRYSDLYIYHAPFAVCLIGE